MKKILTTLAVFGCFAVATQAQTVYISEFLNNDPSGGSTGDSLEFIEIHNPNAVAITLDGYSFSSGVTYTFPAGSSIAAGGYWVVAKDSAAFFRNFAVPARQWASGGALNNSGEPIALKNDLGNTIDSLNYGNAAWVGVAADDVHSMELCNPSADHTLFSSWLQGSHATGVVVASKEILATPGAANTCVAPVPPSYPYYVNSVVLSADTSGVLDSLGVTCELRAVVHSDDFRAGAGYEFAFIDFNNIGIRAFSVGDINGYVLTRGDSLIIRGEIKQFNGLAEIEIDTLIRVSGGNMLVTPYVVPGNFTEFIENSLIRINNVVVVDTPSNTASGMTIRVTNGTNTYEVRIDDNINAFNHVFGTDTFNITGIGSQFDNSVPYDTFFQIWPRDIADFEALGVGVTTLNNNQPFDVMMFPNPATAAVTIRSSELIEGVFVSDMLGRTVVQLQPMNEQFSLETNWGAGIYNVTLIAKNGQMTQRLIVR